MTSPTPAATRSSTNSTDFTAGSLSSGPGLRGGVRAGPDANACPPLNSLPDLVDNQGMDLTLQFCAMAVSSTLILRLALAERARLVSELALARVREGCAVRR